MFNAEDFKAVLEMVSSFPQVCLAGLCSCRKRATLHFNCQTEVADKKKIVLRQARSDFYNWSLRSNRAKTVVQLLSC